MTIRPVADQLREAELDAPRLNVLVADANNYSVLLLQPQGQIDATRDGIRSHDRDLARAQFGKLLDEATRSRSDLVVTPEYSMPWEVLREAVSGEAKGPPQGALWVLGCESIRYRELQALKNELAPSASLVFEPMEPDDTRFVDPLAYVFRTTKSGQGRLVILVQLKTHAMADSHDFEKNHLQLGNLIYQFGQYGAGISLATLICSDVFGFTEEIAGRLHDRALILHLQLNNEPQHVRFVDCRSKLLGLVGDEREILVLNWARGTRIAIDGAATPLDRFARSAWYVKIDRIDAEDSTIATNHRRGLYYTWLDVHRTHTLFLNFAPAVFALTASKVTRVGVAGAVGARRGPQLDAAKVWDAAAARWIDHLPDDGFAALAVRECGNASQQIVEVFHRCPVACERLLALTAGSTEDGLQWHGPRRLDSFRLHLAEQIFRITFCQDTDAKPAEFRVRRLKRCARLWNILHSGEPLPRLLASVRQGFQLEWTPGAPHQNVKLRDNSRATLIYLGEDAANDAVDRAYRAARERVRTSLSERDGEAAKFRVAVWYTDAHGRLDVRCDEPRIDRLHGESEYDIGRES